MIPAKGEAMEANAVGDYLTIDQAAEILQTSRHTLARWRSKKIGPPVCYFNARAVRYRRADLESWLESRIRLNDAA